MFAIADVDTLYSCARITPFSPLSRRSKILTRSSMLRRVCLMCS